MTKEAFDPAREGRQVDLLAYLARMPATQREELARDFVIHARCLDMEAALSARHALPLLVCSVPFASALGALDNLLAMTGAFATIIAAGSNMISVLLTERDRREIEEKWQRRVATELLAEAFELDART